MNAQKLIDDVRAHGGAVELSGGKLLARHVPAEMITRLKAAKPEVMALLSGVHEAANDEQQSPAKNELEAAVMRMAHHYGYTPKDLNFAMRDSARCPSGWQHLVCNDVHAPAFVSQSCCAEWGYVRNEGRATPTEDTPDLDDALNFWGTHT